MLSSRVSLVSKQAPQASAPRGLVNSVHKSKSRGGVLAKVEKGQGSEIESVSLEQGDEEPRDFWEGEKWNVLGEISSFALPVFVVLAVLVGVFAAQTYNQDADVFLDSPKSDIDSAKLYKFE